MSPERDADYRVGIEAEHAVCPDCGHTLPEGPLGKDWKCPWCERHTEVEEAQLSSLGLTPMPEPPPSVEAEKQSLRPWQVVRHCPDCEIPLNGRRDQVRCGKCGAKDRQRRHRAKGNQPKPGTNVRLLSRQQLLDALGGPGRGEAQAELDRREGVWD